MTLPRVVLLAILAFLFACGDAEQRQEPLFQSTDFTPPGSFTSLIEGPATDAAGNVYAVNFARWGTIGIVTPSRESSLFVRLPSGSAGNGIRLNSRGDLMVADVLGHNVLRVAIDTKDVSTYAHEPAMNQPNDLAIRSDDMLYASDPNWQASTGQLWRIDTTGDVELLEADMGTTNGIEISPDERTLYVNESVQRNVWAYDLSPEGNIGNKRLLLQFPDFYVDGMRCDNRGNLYITRPGKGTVAMVSRTGEVLRDIELTGKVPSNIAFGGPDGRTAYVTMQDRGCLESFRVKHPGREWEMLQTGRK
ncbi:SMP-30/gluconolactonase/LRE family protein [Candidatus Binatia bacterium]|nr:SMP-30/gluconolactonase/LRE family protein [Candidatus Binatia bacterium]